MTAAEIRTKFLKYFEEHGHTIVPSSSLIPKDDPTLLFTNSGMVQFKNCFLGLEDRGYTRATSSQKSVRAGGKHNDLENVGYTARHHTFFEMLGNFSFGDYFKKESIFWGWDFLTRVMGLPKDKLWITIYQEDERGLRDLEQADGRSVERIVRMGMESNFWMMGETGPCGPVLRSSTTRDLRRLRPSRVQRGVRLRPPPGDLEPRVHQFDRDKDGNYTPLPNPNIDTGMGLERRRGRPGEAEQLRHGPLPAHHPVRGKALRQTLRQQPRQRRIPAGHRRPQPGRDLSHRRRLPPQQRGPGLRSPAHPPPGRPPREAAGLDKPFLNDIVPVIVNLMKDPYDDLVTKESYIRKVIINEEQRFIDTLDSGLKILGDEVTALKKTGGPSFQGPWSSSSTTPSLPRGPDGGHRPQGRPDPGHGGLRAGHGGPAGEGPGNPGRAAASRPCGRLQAPRHRRHHDELHRLGGGH